MTHETTPPANSSKLVWVGRALSALPALALLMSSGMKLAKSAELVKGFEKFGYDPDLAFGIGIAELVCTILYMIPQTSVLGAILLTGYLGGAVATHVRVGDPVNELLAPAIIGAMLWLGLLLRDRRLRPLLPFRRLES